MGMIESLDNLTQLFSVREKGIMLKAWELAYPDVPVHFGIIKYLGRDKMTSAMEDYCEAVVDPNVRSMEMTILRKLKQGS